MPVSRPDIWSFVMVGLGGCLGAMLRYWVQTGRFVPCDGFAATMLVNISGSFLIGVVYTLLAAAGIRGAWYAFLITGIFGGYTTYSSFSLDFVLLWQQGRAATAVLYCLGTLAGAVGGCAAACYLTSRAIKLLQ